MTDEKFDASQLLRRIVVIVGPQLSDLRQLLSFYREWNHTLAPAIPFAEFVRKVSSLSFFLDFLTMMMLAN